jgi:Helix-turn-helix domain
MLEIGSSLREARERRGLELAKVEAATRIRARYLEALESERFELLPEGPYRRSFLRELRPVPWPRRRGVRERVRPACRRAGGTARPRPPSRARPDRPSRRAAGRRRGCDRLRSGGGRGGGLAARRVGRQPGTVPGPRDHDRGAHAPQASDSGGQALAATPAAGGARPHRSSGQLLAAGTDRLQLGTSRVRADATTRANRPLRPAQTAPGPPRRPGKRGSDDRRPPSHDRAPARTGDIVVSATSLRPTT